MTQKEKKPRRGNPDFGTVWKGKPQGEYPLLRRREVRLSDEMDDKLSMIAAVEGLTVAQLVREILEEYLKD